MANIQIYEIRRPMKILLVLCSLNGTRKKCNSKRHERQSNFNKCRLHMAKTEKTTGLYRNRIGMNNDPNWKAENIENVTLLPFDVLWWPSRSRHLSFWLLGIMYVHTPEHLLRRSSGKANQFNWHVQLWHFYYKQWWKAGIPNPVI